LCSHERKEFRYFKSIKHVSDITIVNKKTGLGGGLAGETHINKNFFAIFNEKVAFFI
jgi:hypothetical protein